MEVKRNWWLIIVAAALMLLYGMHATDVHARCGKGCAFVAGVVVGAIITPPAVVYAAPVPVYEPVYYPQPRVVYAPVYTPPPPPPTVIYAMPSYPPPPAGCRRIPYPWGVTTDCSETLDVPRTIVIRETVREIVREPPSLPSVMMTEEKKRELDKLRAERLRKEAEHLKRQADAIESGDERSNPFDDVRIR